MPNTLILNASEIARLMRPADYRAAVEAAFAALAEGRGTLPAPMHIAAGAGGFHVKGGGFGAGALGPGSRSCAAFKINGNFPENPARRGLPTIQGALVLCDGESGELLAVMDSAEITLMRTAAATAAAARRLARPESATITLCGCGEQAPAQLQALADVLPLRRGFAFDLDRAHAERVVRIAARMGVEMRLAQTLREATLASDVIVTCTPAREPFLGVEDVAPGAFVAAVGADWPAKSEVAPGLMARATVVVDVLEQACVMGDLRHAIAAGAMAAADVQGELGAVILGRAPGRTAADEITLFDSTGAAVQDVASAMAVYERARRGGLGHATDLGNAAWARSRWLPE
jgi:ornithine cyclodeaminase/alanine dehydrogenase-like protein (mu-crystallin family)